MSSQPNAVELAPVREKEFVWDKQAKNICAACCFAIVITIVVPIVMYYQAGMSNWFANAICAIIMLNFTACGIAYLMEYKRVTKVASVLVIATGSLLGLSALAGFGPGILTAAVLFFLYRNNQKLTPPSTEIIPAPPEED
jgi:hypothetical protein